MTARIEKPIGADATSRQYESVNGKPSTPDAVAQLCPACGLCCNGVLFADVELQGGDRPELLAELGLRLKRKRQKLSLPQPCSCFDGKLCRIYGNRPIRCRTFECGILKRVHDREVSIRAALAIITEARAKLKQVEDRLREEGQHDEQLPLSKRCAKLMAQPLDLASNPKAGKRRGELVRAMRDLMELLDREFRA